MCVCVYALMRTYKRACPCVCIHICVYMCICVYIYLCIYLYMYIHIYLYIHLCVSFVYIYICIYMWMCIYAYMFTYVAKFWKEISNKYTSTLQTYACTGISMHGVYTCNLWTYTQIYTYIYMHVHMYGHIYIHIQHCNMHVCACLSHTSVYS